MVFGGTITDCHDIVLNGSPLIRKYKMNTTPTSTDLPLDDLDRLFETANDLDLIPGQCTARFEKVKICAGNGKDYLLFTYQITSGANLNKLAFQRIYLTKLAMPHAKKAVLKIAPDAKKLSDFLIGAVRYVGLAVEIDIRVEDGYANAYLLRSVPSAKSAA
ncbi:MAG: hypothetical protein HQK86_02510 [Nitrospinae bacterium]|nr:hypothetical protein [Nitrospinota bacterium]MBF0633118.1 hypothetical protein [Nitrospinota bacterium]